MRLVLTGLAVLVAVVILLVATALFVLTNTSWGREQVRTVVVGQMEEAVAGRFELGRLDGNLLARPELHDILIEDAEGRPFLAAESVAFRYGLRDLLRQRIVISDLELTNARVVLDDPPGEDWNFSRIFPADPEPDPEPGWGDWVELVSIRLVGTRVTLRTEWQPDEGLPPEEREAEVRRALAGELREVVVAVPGGYQSVMELRDLDARIPRLLVAHPDTADLPLEVAELTGRAEPFGPPGIEILGLSGSLRIGEEGLSLVDFELAVPEARLRADAELGFGEAETRVLVENLDVRTEEGELEGRIDLWVGDIIRFGETRLDFTDLDTRLTETFLPDLELPTHGHLSGEVEASPRDGAEAGSELVRLDAWLDFRPEVGDRSRLAAEGVLELAADPGDVRFGGMVVRVEPLQSSLVRVFVPDLPLHGRVEGYAALDGPVRGPVRIESVLAHRDPVAGVSRVSALGAVTWREEIELIDMRVLLEPLRLDLFRDYLEQVPTGSTLQGAVNLNGAPADRLLVDADLALDEPGIDGSHVTVVGGIDLGEDVRFRNLEIDLEPLRVPLLEALAGDLPVGGSLSGMVSLGGSFEEELTFWTDLLHSDGEERSWIEGDGELTTAGEGWAYVDLTLHRISLVTLGRFFPEAELRGSVAGYLHAEGTWENLLTEVELSLPEEGTLAQEGSFDLSADEPGYNLRVSLRHANLAALTGRISEATLLSGTVEAEGRGVAPETMEVRVVADLQDEEPADPRFLHASGGLMDGLARVDSLEFGVEAARLRARGSFGLTPAREGEISFEAAIDSLRVVAPYVPLSPGVVDPRPAVREAAVEEQETALIEAVREAEIEFLATGEEPPVPDPGEVPTIVGVRRDAMSGGLEATGTARGNLERFDLVGHVSLQEVLAGGHHVGGAEVGLTLHRNADGTVSVGVDAVGESLLLAGFAYDSIGLRADYRGGDGARATAHLAVFQDEDTRIMAQGAYETDQEGWEIRLDDLTFGVEDALYRTSGPAGLRWSEEGLVADDFRLESDRGALISLAGGLSPEGGSELNLLIEALQIAHLLDLLQEREGIRGALWLDLPIRGTLDRPVFDGSARVVGPSIDGADLPDLRARLAYGDQELRLDASLTDAGHTVLTLDAWLPVDLGFGDPEQERLLPRPIRVEARLLDLSLADLSALTDQVERVEGRMTGEFLVEGTFDEPVMEGHLDLVAPSAVIVPLRVQLRDVAGSFELSDHTLTIDSLVAYSRGPVRVAGALDLRELGQPGFDLAIEARNARVINTEDVQMQVDADLTFTGPFDGVVAAGTVRTRSGVIRIPETRELAAEGPLDLQDPRTFERVDQLLVDARDALLEPSPLLTNLQVDLEVAIDRDVWIRSTEANVEIYTPGEIGPLTVRMNGVRPDDIALEGTINTERGEYEFMGRRFNVARGSITFTGGPDLDPLIRLTAEHEVQLPGREAFDIRIILDGTLMDLETELESTAQPPLSQTDLLSLVVFGREAGSLLQQHGSAFGGQGAAGGPLVGSLAGRATQQFATVAMEALVEELETETARALGLDVLRIQPTDAPAEIFTGRAVDVLRGTEVQAGRYVTPRLFVSGQARPTFVHPGAVVEYRTGEGYTFRTSWRPRFLPAVPTLAREPPDRASVLGLIIFREWRF